jgi:acetylornithine deacetylase
MPINLVNTLIQLVALPSVNPMGRDVEGDEYLEGRVTDYLQALFTRWELPWQRQTVQPGRDNIVARLDGDPSHVVMLEAHQDTVPVDGMTIEPWTPDVREGRLYGRGACDIKGGMTAMLTALSRLVEERPEGMPTVVMACSVNEEHGFTGATALTELWQQGDSVFPRKPDAAIVAEPTGLDVVVAHKGIVRWRCHTTGRACHSSQPQLGENAIYRMSAVLRALEQYANNVASTMGEHPRCGRPTLSVGTITGGLSVNTVPDRCTIEIDRRLLPDEDPQEAYRHVVDYVAQQADSQHDPPFMQGGGLSDEHNGPLAESLVSVVRELTGSGNVIGVPYGTDAAAFSAAGVPTVVFGPGSIDQAHTCDEWIELAAVEQASEVLYRFLRS